MIGKVISCSGGLYTVVSENVKYPCRARGIFRKDELKVVAGDDVELSRSSEGTYSIDAVLPRRNLLIRPPLANLDVIFVCVAPRSPEYDPLITDKLITIAEFNKIRPVVVVTKCGKDKEKADSIASVYRKCGFDVFVTDSKEDIGIGELKEYISQSCTDELCAMAGVSGVGKSTLLNRLFPSLNARTGEISGRIQRGKNTTRMTELFPFGEISDISGNGYFADTPGFSSIDFVHFNFYEKEDLPFVFREFEPYLAKCRYTKCTHLKEEGCAIIEAVENGEIPRSRHDSFVAIYGEVKDKHSWDR